MGGSSTGANTNLHAGYRTGTSYTHAHYANDYNIAVSNYSRPIPRIHTITFSTTAGKYYYINGAEIGSRVDASGLTALTSYSNATIGSAVANFFDGDICEFILFNRLLKVEERDAIEVYLGKKWNITVS